MKEDSTSWSILMNSLKEKHTQIAKLLQGKTVCYLDIPIHFNTGDLLIYKGTEKFIEENNINVIYRSDCNYYSHRQIKKCDVILLHGGGNLGDLYPNHQNFREKIISKYKEKLIIILPQTIYFSSHLNFEKTKKIFSSHPNLYLYVRDKKSFSIGEKLTSNVTLMPDMAHSLHPLIDINEINDSSNSCKIINLVRRDIEKNNVANHNMVKKSFDWDDLITNNHKLWRKIYNISAKFSFLNKKSIYLWEKVSDEIVFISENHFYMHDIVYTDRLHGIILSTLLGKKIHLIDNSYGKNSSYINAWLKKYPYFINETD
ncbi:polysaccharide pyruvyl transferase family protein [Morganella morganii]|uniref:Polysaccharide pyruvyl transferase family protein n=1 Tax=bacterium 19GA11TI05 TaxID=2920688 RepID=A0AAU6TVD7_UNCXX|nr:polysaccharide pyruvyl transferase family protein [Morganella morganii]MDW7795352.1 polysaccharide pyruvyl transferase family protein [Morganella morganii]